MNTTPFRIDTPAHRPWELGCPRGRRNPGTGTRRAGWSAVILPCLAVAGSLLAPAITAAAEVFWTNITGKMGWGQTVGPGDGTPGAPNNWSSTPDFPGEFDDVIFDNRANDDGIWIGGPGYGTLGYRIVNSMTFRESNVKRILAWSVESTLTSSRRLDILGGLVVEADSGPVQMGDAINASTGILRIGAGPTTFVRNDSPIPLTFGSLANTGTEASIYGQRLTAGYADQPGASVRLLPLEGSGAGGMVFNGNIQDGSTNTSGSRPLGVQVNVPNGTVVFNVPNAYTGPTVIDAGTLAIRSVDRQGATVFGSIASSRQVTVNAGGTLDATGIPAGSTLQSPSVVLAGGTLSATTLAVDPATGIAALAINAGTLGGSPAVTVSGGGQMSLASDVRVGVGVGSLAVDQAAGGGRLDLGAGQVTVAAGGITAAELRADLVAGRAGGGWNGTTGIMSGAAAASGGTRAVGYVVNGDGSARVSFAAAGDVDLNGTVNVFDLVAINASGTYGTGGASVWSQGDFNYDGVTNVFDLVGVNTGGVYGQGNYFPAPPAPTGGFAAVPEPGGLALVCLGAAAALAAVSRRRTGYPHRGTRA